MVLVWCLAVDFLCDADLPRLAGGFLRRWVKAYTEPWNNGESEVSGIYGGFVKWGTPSHHPFLDGIFPIKNHPAMGVSPWLWKPPDYEISYFPITYPDLWASVHHCERRYKDQAEDRCDVDIDATALGSYHACMKNHVVIASHTVSYTTNP